MIEHELEARAAKNRGEELIYNSKDAEIDRGAARTIRELRSQNERYSATIDKAMLTLDFATEGFEQLKRHRDDLLEANNRYLERARAAEALVRRLPDVMTDRELQAAVALGDAARTSVDLGQTIAELGKFVDMIEARAMAVDGPVTPFCEELHAASDLEKSTFQAILSKLYQFRNAWAKKPLVPKEWVERKAALEGDLDCTTGAPVDPHWPKAWKIVCELFLELGYGDFDRYEHTAVISTIAGRTDSLDFVEMLIELEKVSGFLIDESELPNFKTCTIGDVVRLLASKMAKGTKG
jgi:acyl carrier protein